MSVRSGQSWSAGFNIDFWLFIVSVSNPDSTPAATLVVDGTDNAAVVTITGSSPNYKAAVTLPALTNGQTVQLRFAIVLSGTTYKEYFAYDTCDITLDSNGRVDVIKVAGTAQTARDLGANIDAAISSRMATYTQPTGFLTSTFSGTIASTANLPTSFSGMVIDSSGRLDVSKLGGTAVASFVMKATDSSGNAIALASKQPAGAAGAIDGHPVLLDLMKIVHDGRVWFIAPSSATPAGNDANAGTPAAPKLTLAGGQSAASAGDTLAIMNGTYNAGFTLTKSLTIRGQSKTGVILTSTGPDGVFTYTVGGFELSNLTIDATNGAESSIFSDSACDHIRFSDLYLTSNGGDVCFLGIHDDVRFDRVTMVGLGNSDGINTGLMTNAFFSDVTIVTAGAGNTRPLYGFDGSYTYENCRFVVSRSVSDNVETTVCKLEGSHNFINCDFRGSASHASYPGAVKGFRFNTDNTSAPTVVTIQGGSVVTSNAGSPGTVYDIEASGMTVLENGFQYDPTKVHGTSLTSTADDVRKSLRVVQAGSKR